jgi:hypothetical protein
LEEEVACLQRGKKRKAIPNPNRRFMTIAEAVASGEGVAKPKKEIKKQKVKVVDNDEAASVIEVAGDESDENTESEGFSSPLRRTRSGWETKKHPYLIP